MSGRERDEGAPKPEPPTRAVALKERALAGAGYPAALAATLAADAAVDLREALGLVRAGFPPEVAADMLRDGRRPVF